MLLINTAKIKVTINKALKESNIDPKLTCNERNDYNDNAAEVYP
ncbi:hypothetical protein JOD43_001366 [Pullulanibacillus pueri]|nr:hypothetical protein [Pullulanibacillus pueri]